MVGGGIITPMHLLRGLNSCKKSLLLIAGFQLAAAGSVLAWRPAALVPVGLVLGGSFLAAMLVLAACRHRFRQRLERLRGVTEAIGRGEGGALAGLDDDVELRSLAPSLTVLADTLGDHRREQERLRERLARSEKLALIGELTATAAHEINNPLDGLQSSTRIIRRSLSDERQARQLLDLMDGGLYRIEMIVRRLLAMSRDEPPILAEIALDEVMNEAAAFVAPRLERCQVVLVRDLQDEGLAVSGDRLPLVQALINLLLNGADAMGSGGKLILRGRREEHVAVLEVIDTGEGIAPEHLPHVFEPFYTTKPRGRGTGLGLAVVRRVVEAHGGEVQVFSRQGRGTRFRIELPAIPVRGGGSPRTTDVNEGATARAALGPSETARSARPGPAAHLKS